MPFNRVEIKLLELSLQMFYFPKRFKKIKNQKNLYLLKSDMDEKENAKDLIYIFKTKNGGKEGIRGKKVKKIFSNFYFVQQSDVFWDSWYGISTIQPLINSKNQLKSNTSINKFNL